MMMMMKEENWFISRENRFRNDELSQVRSRIFPTDGAGTYIYRRIVTESGRWCPLTDSLVAHPKGSERINLTIIDQVEKTFNG